MLDFGATELFIIAVLAIIVVGPKELPKLIRSVMGMVRKVREMGSEFQAGVKKMADEVELDAVTRKLNEVGNIDLDAKKPAADPAAEFSDYKEFDYDEYDYDGGGYAPPSKKEDVSSEEGAEPTEEVADASDEPLVETPSLGDAPEKPKKEAKAPQAKKTAQPKKATQAKKPAQAKKTKQTKKTKSAGDV